jgi:hypothetical protein
MKTWTNGQTVDRGFYVGPWFDVQYVGADGEALDGKPGAAYVRVPTLLMLAISPVAGGIFVLAFPLIALGALLVAMAQPVVWAARRAGESFAPLLKPRYQPVAAYLGEPSEKDDEAKAEAADDELGDLRDEVATKRTDDDEVED